jgi:hypothetical protein
MRKPHAYKAESLQRGRQQAICLKLASHYWLVQQWAPGTRFALLDEPAVAPRMAGQYHD